MRSKTIGDDQSQNFRLVVGDRCCVIHSQAWLSVGWTLLAEHANFPRDYHLFLDPRTTSEGVKIGVHTRRRLQGSKTISQHGAAAWNCTREDTEIPRGVATKDSDRYAPVAKQKNTSMKFGVARSFHDTVTTDPLGELESIEHLDEHWISLTIPGHDKNVC